MAKIAGSGSINKRHGSADTDAYQNVTEKRNILNWKVENPVTEPASI